VDSGVDPRPQRTGLPPGQREVARAPIVHVGDVPEFDARTWDLALEGELGRSLRLAWRDVAALPRVVATEDLHGATGWSARGLRWEGVRLATLLDACRPHEQARFLAARDRDGYSTSLALEDLDAQRVLLAVGLDGAPLPPARGGPLRLIVPERYAWKSVKWLRRLDFLTQDEPGFWERRGAHPSADPWRGERVL
jgi:DMSO/TMAO reductase YedYZ molybdopterin-dependent catalytic subunit